MRLIDADKLKYDIYKHFYIKYGGVYMAGEISDIIDMQQTISDAAENEPPESNECEYCCGEPMRPLDWQYGLDHIFPDYKYCPMCGRYLKGKNENECK